jgi:hypothetical protein
MVWIVLGGFVLALMAIVGLTVVAGLGFLLWLLVHHLFHQAAVRLHLDGKKRGSNPEPRRPITH